LSVDLFPVMVILSASAILVNAIQPLAGALLPKRGSPLLLAFTPLFGAGIACVGLTHRYWAVAALLLVGASAVGLFHNEAVLTLQRLTRRRHGLAVAVFMSGGYFGIATGALAGGWWAQNLGLSYFWVWGSLGAAVTGLIVFSGLHRFEVPGFEALASEEESQTSFGIVLGLAVSIATGNVILMRLMPVYLVRSFGTEAQVWGGAVFFAIGLAGAVGSYAWGFLSARHGHGPLIVFAWLLGSPFLYLLLHPSTPQMVVVWGPAVGFTIGGVFPLTVVLARSARGWSQRLRLGCVIGVAWGLGEVAVVLITKYIDRFPRGAVEPVAWGLRTCWLLVCFTVLLGCCTALQERKWLPTRRKPA